jgi:hypothetical protein
MQNLCAVGAGVGKEVGVEVGTGDGQLSSQFVEQMYTNSFAQPVSYTLGLL